MLQLNKHPDHHRLLDAVNPESLGLDAARQVERFLISRAADAFMAVDPQHAIHAMKRLANPIAADPAVVAGESGGWALQLSSPSPSTPSSARGSAFAPIQAFS